MAKKNSKKAVKAETGRGPGRPSTFPAGTEVVAFPTRVAKDTLEQLRELAENRKNPFGLGHNSIGAELYRIVGEAHRRMVANRKPARKEEAPVIEPAPETVTV